MAITSAGTYLGYKKLTTTSNIANGVVDKTRLKAITFDKLADIKSIPETGSAPERIETTTLSNKKKRTYIDGLQDTAELSFTANYDKVKYHELQEISNDDQYAIVLLLSDGSVFYWEGTPSVFLNGGEINSVMEMTINVSAETEILLVDGVKGTFSDTANTIAISDQASM